MRFSLNKDYCLWVVPPNDGKVRKFRFTLKRMAMALLLGVAFGAALTFVLGDYARLQLVRIENYFYLRKLTSERNDLIDRTQLLSAQLKDLKEAKDKAVNYQQDVKDRLQQLARLVESATALGVFEKPSKDKKNKESDAVGGAEVECRAGSCSGFFSGLLSNSTESSLTENSGNELLKLNTTEVSDVDGAVVALLEKLIEALKVIPFGLPAKGDVSSYFGVRYSPFEHGLRMHEGIDFSMPHGSKIYAAGYGTVVDVGWNGAYGQMVDIRHNGRIVSRYAHMSKILVKKGDKISRGQVIGLVGSTGRSTGPHLHFEVLVDGRQKNPARFLQLAKELQKLM